MKYIFVLFFINLIYAGCKDIKQNNELVIFTHVDKAYFLVELFNGHKGALTVLGYYTNDSDRSDIETTEKSTNIYQKYHNRLIIFICDSENNLSFKDPTNEYNIKTFVLDKVDENQIPYFSYRGNNLNLLEFLNTHFLSIEESKGYLDHGIGNRRDMLVHPNYFMHNNPRANDEEFAHSVRRHKCCTM